jgi:hypothetical protein
MTDAAIALLKELIENNEPDWVTHPQSVWNRARRLILKHEKGEDISEARSYDKKAGIWIM